MRMPRRIGLFVVLCLGVGGCATTDQQVQMLKSKNQELVQQLADRENAITILKNDKAYLQKELEYYSQRSKVLQKEKQARMSSAAELRQGVREFTDNVMNSLRSYYQKTELVDTVGSEICPRSLVGEETNRLLVDFAHPMPADGTLIGGNAYLSAPTQLYFCLLRETPEKNGRYSIMRMSELVAADAAGSKSWTFKIPLAAKKDDLIGIFFPESITVPYDDVDTGNVVLLSGPVKAGDVVTPKQSPDRRKRAYSFGATGFLNQ